MFVKKKKSSKPMVRTVLRATFGPLVALASHYSFEPLKAWHSPPKLSPQAYIDQEWPVVKGLPMPPIKIDISSYHIAQTLHVALKNVHHVYTSSPIRLSAHSKIE